MLKIINTKTIAGTTLTIALLAGTLATPAFAKGGYNNDTYKESNRSTTSLEKLDRLFAPLHSGGLKIFSVKGIATRSGPGFGDIRWNTSLNGFEQP